MTKTSLTISVNLIQDTIHLIRGERVILDSDLAALYGVTTRRLNEQVKRNRQRFPKDFIFQLTPEESRLLKEQGAMGLNLKSQNATSRSHGGDAICYNELVLFDGGRRGRLRSQ